MQRLMYGFLILVIIPLQARQLYNPLELYFAPYRYPYFEHMCPDENSVCCVEIMGSAYYRYADKAFGCKESLHACDSIAELIFGQSSFTIAQAFANGVVGPSLANNPFLTISLIRPNFEYQEHGALFAMNINVSKCRRWRGGVRMRLPVRDIKVSEVCCNGIAGSGGGSETLADVYQKRIEMELLLNN